MSDLLATDWQPDPPWWEALMCAVDSRDAGRFLAFLAPDASFRFGNAAPLVGTESIGPAVAGFFRSIAASRHEIIRTWGCAPSVACEGRVTYTRHDGSQVSFPFVNAFDLRGTRITSYRIYIDNALLFAAT